MRTKRYLLLVLEKSTLDWGYKELKQISTSDIEQYCKTFVEESDRTLFIIHFPVSGFTMQQLLDFNLKMQNFAIGKLNRDEQTAYHEFMVIALQHLLMEK